MTSINIMIITTFFIFKLTLSTKLVIRDLTLWDIQVDKCSSPFVKESALDDTDKIMDSKGNLVSLFPDTKRCLSLLQSGKIPMAVASRIADIAGAYQLLHLLDIKNFFEFIEIYPTNKRLHFQRIHIKSGIKFEDMVFYDDIIRNIKDISRLGVDCVWVAKGISIEHLNPVLKLLPDFQV